MDYRAFYGDDVVGWIQEANQAALKLGMDNSEFWVWVAESASGVCKKHQDNQLVIKQMIMLFEWLEEVHYSRKSADTK